MSKQEAKTQQLKEKSIDLMKNFDPNVPLMNQIQENGLKQYLNIFVDELDFPPCGRVGVKHLYQQPELRLSVYCLPKGSIMKLHDHPTMKVVTYILEGSMEARIFNKEKSQQEDEETLFRKDVYQFGRDQLVLIEGETDNLHEFVGGHDSCKFLDIIFPDYDGVNRVLTHYNYQKVGQNEDEVDLYRISANEDYQMDLVQL